MPLVLVLLLGALTWAEKPFRTPVVEWTVGDAPDFRYGFLEPVQTRHTGLLLRRPEAAMIRGHGLRY